MGGLDNRQFVKKPQYIPERNELIITSCHNCPFLKDEEEEVTYEYETGVYKHSVKFVPRCYFKVNIYTIRGNIYVTPPPDCPLRDPNFKLTRDFGN